MVHSEALKAEYEASVRQNGRDYALEVEVTVCVLNKFGCCEDSIDKCAQGTSLRLSEQSQGRMPLNTLYASLDFSNSA